MDTLDMLPLTTIAVVHGVCFGGGFELALTCDMLIAEKSARFCFPELRLGIIPGFGGIPRLRRDVGNALIRDLLLSGRSIGAKKALAVGLVSQVVASGEGLDAARSLAAQSAKFDADRPQGRQGLHQTPPRRRAGPRARAVRPLARAPPSSPPCKSSSRAPTSAPTCPERPPDRPCMATDTITTLIAWPPALRRRRGQLQPDDDLFERLGIDSFQAVELISDLEERVRRRAPRLRAAGRQDVRRPRPEDRQEALMLDLGKIPSLGEALRDATISFKSRTALIESDRHRETGRWTYAELRDRGRSLRRRPAGPRLRRPATAAPILMQNQAKWLIGATGALWAGATLVPLDYKLTAPEQPPSSPTPSPASCSPSGRPGRSCPESQAMLRDGPRRRHRGPRDARLGRARRFEDLTGKPLTFAARTRDDVACIVYSSGTGGTPKGCMLTHANYLAQAEVLGRMYPMLDGDRYFSVLPTNHAIDFMCGFLIPFMMGGAVVHQRTLRPAYLGATMERYGITHIALVPTILKNLEKKIRDRLDDLPKWQRLLVDQMIDVNEFATRKRPRPPPVEQAAAPIHAPFGGKLRLIFCGGAFVERACAEFFNRLGLPSRSATASPRPAPSSPSTTSSRSAATASASPSTASSSSSATATTPASARSGSAAPPSCAATSTPPSSPPRRLVDGWLRTGDLGVIDAAGHLKLVGRAKNMIVTEGGKNVYPEDIETAFTDLDDCEECCVFAVSYLWPTGALGDERLVLVVRPKSSTQEEGPDDDDDDADAVQPNAPPASSTSCRPATAASPTTSGSPAPRVGPRVPAHRLPEAQARAPRPRAARPHRPRRHPRVIRRRMT
jgi:long-chain acyl-CoA synthetase